MTPVARWTPPFREALRLAWRPALSFVVFTGLGSLVFILTAAYYSRGKDIALFGLGFGAGIIGIVAGQVIAILRVRALPVFVVTGACVVTAVWFMALAHPPGGEDIAIPIVFFLFAFPCGLLSLMHRWELFASFWPAVGWIGSVFWILNHEHRITVWEKNKAAAWLPVPLVFLGCFLVLWVVYLAAKQAARVEMWQALSGAAARRIEKAPTKKNRVGVFPRKNLVAILVIAGLLFGGTAVLAPYLWRTGKGEHDSNTKPEERPDPKRGPDIDAQGLVEQLRKLANAAKQTLPKLWPLLLLFALYRPTKRALLLTHLKTPVVPTPPSERIDNLWEYVRIAAEDAEVVPASADSVEQLMTRIRQADRSSPALEQAAQIYIRTRYGFTVQRGDAIAMRTHATEAASALRKDISAWKRIKNLWRPLS